MLAIDIAKCFGLIMCHWISHGTLITLEKVGDFYNGRPAFDFQRPHVLLIDIVPVNLKNEDAFHITIEEYLHGLVNMSEELSRLALNAVTLGDYKRPIQISKFVKVSTTHPLKVGWYVKISDFR